MTKHSTCILFTLAIFGITTSIGCVASSDLTQPAASPEARSRVGEWKKWEYPNTADRSITNADPGTLVMYQASTKDAFAEVLRHYEKISGISGLSDTQSAGGWSAKGVGAVETVHAFQGPASSSRRPTDRVPNECSFLVRESEYSVTAFIRQEPPGDETRITLIFETK